MNGSGWGPRIRGLGVVGIAVMLILTLSTSIAGADDTNTTNRVQGLLQNGSTNATVGLYLKEVGGPVHASSNEQFVFEPASTIKALIHFHAMKQVEDGTVIGGDPVTLNRQIPNNWATTQNSGSCPQPSSTSFQTLEDGLGAMMRPSDNPWTQALRDFFGDGNIDSTRQTLGMDDTALNHLIGCAGQALSNPNQLTLEDAGTLYEEVATGYLNQATRQDAYDIMLTDGNRFNSIIDDEASSLGLSSSAVNDFKSERRSALKAGSYTLIQNNQNQEYRSVAGWAELGFKDTNCAVDPTDFVYGAFVDNASQVSLNGGIRGVGVELFREQIRNGLNSWVDCESDLEIVSTDVVNPPDEIDTNTDVTVTVEQKVRNNGPAEVIDADVTLAPTFPQSCTVTPDPDVQPLGNMQEGQTATVSQQFTLNCSETGNHSFQFDGEIEPQNSNVEDPNSGNNTGSDELSLDAIVTADLSIEKTDSPDPAVAGEELDYTLTVTNNGPDQPDGVQQVVDEFPEGVTPVSDAPPACTFNTGAPDKLVCTFGALSVGETISIGVTVLVDQDLVYQNDGPLIITNTAEVTIASEFTVDPKPGNNSDSAETEIVAESDLAILSFEETGTPDEILIGEPVEVTLDKVITNNGPSAPMDVDVDASATASGGASVSPAPDNPDQALALDEDETRSLTETFTLACDAPGQQTFTFQNTVNPLDPADQDPKPGNNNAVVEVTVDCLAPVAVNIKPGSDPNSVNLRSRQGVVPVAVLTTGAGEYGLPVAFDATAIDPLSVTFGTADALFNTSATGSSEQHQRGHIEDAYELDEQTLDGDDDMVLHFPVQNSGLESGDSEACVKGTFTAGGETHTFFGCDSITTRPGN